jgi:hypothetical protein
MLTFKKVRSNFNSLGEVLLFVRIFLLATILPLLIKHLTIPRLLKLLTPQNSNSGRISGPDEIIDKIEKYTLYILSRDFWIYRNICLKRSLVLYHFLREYGIHVTLCFGVRYNNEGPHGAEGKKMEGHAWLLHNGDIFLEKNAEETKKYKMTYCYPEIISEVKEKGLTADIEGLM